MKDEWPVGELPADQLAVPRPESFDQLTLVVKDNLLVAMGAGLGPLLATIKSEDREVLAISVGKTNAEWLVQAAARRRIQSELVLGPLTERPLLNAG